MPFSAKKDSLTTNTFSISIIGHRLLCWWAPNLKSITILYWCRQSPSLKNALKKKEELMNYKQYYVSMRHITKLTFSCPH